jgi:hypothetical protein
MCPDAGFTFDSPQVLIWLWHSAISFGAAMLAGDGLCPWLCKGTLSPLKEGVFEIHS